MAFEIHPSARDRSLPRVLIAVHGHEPADWAREAARVVQRLGHASARVAAVLELPRPAFTSLLPVARRRFGAARAGLREAEIRRLQGRIDPLLAALVVPVEVVHLDAPGADAGRAIARYAQGWSAEVVVVGRDTRSRVWRALLGAVHERVLRAVPCAVLVPGLDEAAGWGAAPAPGVQVRA
jgi:nucleotide-binding universal stress UspA family protein